MEEVFEVCKLATKLELRLTLKGYGKIIEEYIFFLRAKLAFHRQHPEFNGTSIASAPRCIR
jgi:hypothetical protein